MEFKKPDIKLSANVAQLYELMSNQHRFGNQTDFEGHFDFFIRCSIADSDYDGGVISKHVSDIKDVDNEAQWSRLAKRLFQLYAMTTFDIKREKLMKEFIENLTDEQNEWIQEKIIQMVKKYYM